MKKKKAPLDQLKEFEKALNSPVTVVKFTALKNGLLSYYSTVKGFQAGLGYAFYNNLPGEETEYDNDNHLVETYYNEFCNSVVYFHQFFELHIKDVLAEYHPELANDWKKVDTTKSRLDYLETGKIEIADNTVSFLKALETLRGLKDNQKEPSKKIKLKVVHNFLADEKNQKSLEKLHEYRNSILHKAGVVLPLIPFDYFITQHILPIAYEIIKTEKSHILEEIEKPVACQVEIIKRILKLSFKIEDLRNDNIVGFPDTIQELAHLKELGRASYSIPTMDPLNIIKDKISEENSDPEMEPYNFIADYYALESQFEIAEEWAQLKSKKPSARVYHIKSCPCCGGFTLLTYWRVDIPMPFIPRAYKEVSEATCIFCSYTVNQSMEEPSKYGIKVEPLFYYIEMNSWPFPTNDPSIEEIEGFDYDNVQYL